MSEQAQRLSALRAGARLEAFSVAWMVLEAVIAIGAGIVAGSVLLTAFGLDSAIELVSGATLLWRLSAEARSSDLERIEEVEGRAIWVSTVLLILLCVYLVVTSVAGLLLRHEPQQSWVGLGIAAAAVIVMPLLAWRKRLANAALKSPALRADIAESITCAYMAAATLVGVALSFLVGWWWAEYVAAFALLLFVGHEALEALEAARNASERCDDN